MAVITLCGSVTKTPKPVWDKLAQALTLQGHIVLMVNVWGIRDYLHNDPKGQEEKKLLDAIHKRKIAMSNMVYVLTLNDYVGESTQSEIDFAYQMMIPIKYFNYHEDDISSICADLRRNKNE